MNQKSLISVLAVAVLILGGTAVYFLTAQKSIAPVVPTPTPVSKNVPAVQSSPAVPAVQDETVNWKTYTDPVVGFTFKYPSNASNASEGNMAGLTFRVGVNNLNSMENMPMGYDKTNIAKDKEALSNGDPSISFGMPVPNSLKMLAVETALAKELTILSELEVCNVQFDREAIIYKGDYQIVLSWEYAGTDIQRNNPDYFKIDTANCGSDKIWKDSAAFYSDLVAGKTDSVSQNWFTNFDKIIKTFQFTK